MSYNNYDWHHYENNSSVCSVLMRTVLFNYVKSKKEKEILLVKPHLSNPKFDGFSCSLIMFTYDLTLLTRNKLLESYKGIHPCFTNESYIKHYGQTVCDKVELRIR